MKRVELAVFDLDNTLYDWYASFLPAFYAMVDVATSILKCDRDALLDELRSVHVKHHDVEHPFSLLETKTVQEFVSQERSSQALQVLDPAFHAFNKTRKENLALFPDVRTTLDELRTRDITLIAFTDSSYFATLHRIRQLGLANVFQHIFCRAKSKNDSPFPVRPPPEDNLIHITTELPADETKPDPRVLFEIARVENKITSSIAYIGDSISRDVLMAKKADCFAIWAKYGVHKDSTMYEKLVRISHWTTEDIQREKNYVAEAEKIKPDFVCERSIGEILTVLDGPTGTLTRRQQRTS
ncbi:HAD family hydrolase [Bradyrhizobium sp. SRL28]|uniref:HAD family hydrolase n=1 Tax=Bradyrhizobium sp. SRL28 TaxID=2836178 RepID=UPI001BDF4169|nr:HAD family hydrolase [Bradyrhizobium sp. SRL28]MBT1514364.1 HAD family hydrolase [Bradyrhizobium sp. SRL28]